MFYLSSKHHFDIMFVILCVVAGATSLIIPNTSKTYINQLNNTYRASFIDFILDSSLIKLLHSRSTIKNDSAALRSSNHESDATKFHQQSPTVCLLLSNLLNGDQMKFCQRHQDVLELILPQIIQLTKKECARITTDFRWNCTAIDFLLDRSSPLAFTKEAALVRSILNASMMYLVVKACIEGSYRSCGCQSTHHLPTYNDDSSDKHSQTYSPSLAEVEKTQISESQGFIPYPVFDQPITKNDISRLNSGYPLRLTNSINQRQGCRANIGFAYAFTKVFIELDDMKALKKAYRILNEDHNYIKSKNKSSYVKRLVDSDNKDLAYIKWSKSAINIHNNHIGRQFVRDAIQRRCRCHGISGVCQFQTCWDHLLDFDVVSSRIRSVYLTNTTQVEVMNLGTFEKPDLSLARVKVELVSRTAKQIPIDNQRRRQHSTNFIGPYNEIEMIRSNEFIYLYESPDYCEPQPNISHHGVAGRACANMNNITITSKTSKKSPNPADPIEEFKYDETKQLSFGETLGSCKQLCCNRGFRGELVFHMVNCNCRFKFCCEIQCDQCLRQRVQHYCL